MSRATGNWLQAYKEYTKELEAPDSYHLWTGLSILASAARRNIYLNQEVYYLFPNLFVILVAPAGKIGKSTVIRMGRTILQAVPDVYIGPDSVTREELIREMAKAGKDKTSSAVTIHSTELSSLIDESGIKMVQFLTDIYDCDYKNPKGWRYSTKTQGKDIIKNPVLNLLAGTIPNWISDSMPVEATTHGFTSRTIFVFEDQPRFSRPFPGKADNDLILGLQEDLKQIASLQGPFAWTQAGRDYYTRIYNQWQKSPPRDYRIEGFHWRKRIHVLKIAMLLRIAESDELVLDERDIKAAEALISMVERNMPKTFSGVGKYEYASDVERIYKEILIEDGIAVSRIYERYYMIADQEQIFKILRSLQMMKRIVLEAKNGELWALPAKKDTTVLGST